MKARQSQWSNTSAISGAILPRSVESVFLKIQPGSRISFSTCRIRARASLGVQWRDWVLTTALQRSGGGGINQTLDGTPLALRRQPVSRAPVASSAKAVIRSCRPFQSAIPITLYTMAGILTAPPIFGFWKRRAGFSGFLARPAPQRGPGGAHRAQELRVTPC